MSTTSRRSLLSVAILNTDPAYLNHKINQQEIQIRALDQQLFDSNQARAELEAILSRYDDHGNPQLSYPYDAGEVSPQEALSRLQARLCESLENNQHIYNSMKSSKTHIKELHKKYRKEIAQVEDLYVLEMHHMKKEFESDNKKLQADHEAEYLAHKVEYDVREQQHQKFKNLVKDYHVERIVEMGRSQEAKITKLEKEHGQIITDLQDHHQSVVNRIRSEHTLATMDLKQTHEVEMSQSKAAYSLLARQLNDAVTYQHTISRGLQEGLDVFRAGLNTIFSHQPRCDRSEEPKSDTETYAEAPESKLSPLPLSGSPEQIRPSQEDYPGVTHDVVNDHSGVTCGAISNGASSSTKDAGSQTLNCDQQDQPAQRCSSPVDWVEVKCQMCGNYVSFDLTQCPNLRAQLSSGDELPFPCFPCWKTIDGESQLDGESTSDGQFTPDGSSTS